MDVMQALNVTIYSLGIVFLSLLVLMVAIMILTKIFSVATGKDLMSVTPAPAAVAAAPPVAVAPAPQAVAAPAAAPQPAAAVPAAPTGVAAASPAFKMSVAGKEYEVELQRAASGASLVVMDGISFQVQPDKAGGTEVVVDGKSHNVEVRDLDGTSATVVVDGVSQRVQIERLAGAAEEAEVEVEEEVEEVVAAGGASEHVTAPLPGKVLAIAVKVGDAVKQGDELCVIEAMKMGNSIKASKDGVVQDVMVSVGQQVNFGAPLVAVAVAGTDTTTVKRRVRRPAPAVARATASTTGSFLRLGPTGKEQNVEIRKGAGGASLVFIGDTTYRVEKSRENLVTVNGVPHSVEVKEIRDDSAMVIVDGVVHTVNLSKAAQPAAAPAQVAAQPSAPVRPAPAPAPVAVPVPAPAPAPAPAPSPAPAAAPAPAAGGHVEQVTAPLPGKVLSVTAKAGDRLQQGDELCVIEAMKMGNSIKAQRPCTVQEVLIAPGQQVGFGAPLFVIQ